ARSLSQSPRPRRHGRGHRPLGGGGSGPTAERPHAPVGHGRRHRRGPSRPRRGHLRRAAPGPHAKRGPRRGRATVTARAAALAQHRDRPALDPAVGGRRQPALGAAQAREAVHRVGHRRCAHAARRPGGPDARPRPARRRRHARSRVRADRRPRRARAGDDEGGQRGPAARRGRRARPRASHRRDPLDLARRLQRRRVRQPAGLGSGVDRRRGRPVDPDRARNDPRRGQRDSRLRARAVRGL
ncbi:MAG: hypothetical protein AVDCRST_MAG85-3060, partial [uncultured Solirubrobacteraceae bacterium]